MYLMNGPKPTAHKFLPTSRTNVANPYDTPIKHNRAHNVWINKNASGGGGGWLRGRWRNACGTHTNIDRDLQVCDPARLNMSRARLKILHRKIKVRPRLIQELIFLFFFARKSRPVCVKRRPINFRFVIAKRIRSGVDFNFCGLHF